MKRVKAKTLEEFFDSAMGRNAWKRGIDLVDSTNIYPDGRYETKLLVAEFEVPKLGRPQIVFLYDMGNGHIIKRIQIDTPQGLAALLNEYRHLGLAPATSHKDIELRNTSLTLGKPEVHLDLSTNKAGVQVISVHSAKWYAKNAPAVLEAPPAPAVQEKEPEPEPNLPEPASAPESHPETPQKEVDLTVGMRIRFTTTSGEATGRVKMILEDEREVIVIHDAGDHAGGKEVIHADSILAILAD